MEINDIVISIVHSYMIIDEDGMSNNAKWNYILYTLDLDQLNILEDHSFSRAYDESIETELLAWIYLATLRVQVYAALINVDKGAFRHNNYQQENSYYWFKKLLDKYRGMPHIWLN